MTQDFDAFERDYNARIAHGIATVDPLYTITGYRAHRTRDGVAFVATLRYNRRIVGTIEDSGTGGGPRTYCNNPKDQRAWEREADRVFPGDFLAGETLIEALLQKAGK